MEQELAHMISVRAMDEGDLDVGRKIFLNARRAAFHWLDGSPFALEDFDRQTVDEQVWVAEVLPGVVGFVAIYLPDNYVHHLFVEPGHRGKGIGTKLLQFALQRAARALELKCSSANLAGCRFYEQRGGREVERGIDEVGSEFVRYRWDGA
jgi:GNAT superfamily N-acetyltransferase